MNAHIFRQYDIRGIAETDLTDAVVEGLGRAFATRARRIIGTDNPVIGVGNDMRLSSTRLLKALSRGLAASGASVKQLGLVPTPVVYFAKYELELDGVIQITGSHNPGEYNGFKMMMAGDTLHGDSIQELRVLIEEEDYLDGDGKIARHEGILDTYLEWVRDDIELGDRTLKVVVDCGNGVGGVCAEDLVADVLGQDFVGMFLEPDGSFPNHHPDPTVPENLDMMCAKVKELGADVGIAYDGDADRIGICDEKGNVIFGDTLMILLSRALLEEIPGATIIGEVKCSQNLFDDIEAHGGTAIMARVGHSLIKAKIKETGAELAGEMSGHVFYNDRYFGFDDALYTTARLVEILTATDKSVSELLADVPKTFVTPEIRQDCSEELKFDVPGIVAKHYADQGLEVNTIDGVRVNFGDGWALCRASNTQPVVVLRVEAKTLERRDELLAGLRKAVAAAEAELRGA